MIPKIIHICWLGGGKKPKLAETCAASIKKFCPDWKIVEWNEQNFDIASAPLYVRQAYDAKKYAFVSDYVRLWALVKHGGVYVDTDVEICRPIDEFLSERAFSGFETETQIPTGIMACEAGFPLFEEFLREYDMITFLGEDGTQDTTTNVKRITDICLRHGFTPGGEKQTVEGFTLYPREYFCPFDPATGVLASTKNTAAIHWFGGSWLSPAQRLRARFARPFHRIFGKDCFSRLKRK